MKEQNWKDKLQVNPNRQPVVNPPTISIQELVRRVEELEQSNKKLIEITSLDMLKIISDKEDKYLNMLRSALSKIEELEIKVKDLSPKTNIPQEPVRVTCRLWGVTYANKASYKNYKKR